MKYQYDKETEAELQTKCETWLHIQGLTFLHIPDGLYRFMYGNYLGVALHKDGMLYGFMQGTRKLISKYLLGFPDLLIFGEDGRFIAVELKTKTGKVRQSQKKIHRKIPVRVIRDFKTFTETIEEWQEEQ